MRRDPSQERKSPGVVTFRYRAPRASAGGRAATKDLDRPITQRAHCFFLLDRCMFLCVREKEREREQPSFLLLPPISLYSSSGVLSKKKERGPMSACSVRCPSVTSAVMSLLGQPDSLISRSLGSDVEIARTERERLLWGEALKPQTRERMMWSCCPVSKLCVTFCRFADSLFGTFQIRGWNSVRIAHGSSDIQIARWGVLTPDLMHDVLLMLACLAIFKR